MKISKSLFLLTAVMVLFMFANIGWAKNVQVDMQLPPEIKVTKFECTLGEKAKMADKPVTLCDFSVMNVSDEPALFQGFILVPETGQSAGGYIPRKGDPPQLKPGEEMEFQWAVRMFELPKEKVTFIVEKVQ